MLTVDDVIATYDFYKMSQSVYFKKNEIKWISQNL